VLKRIENMSFETKYNNRKKFLEGELNIKKHSKNKLVKEICTLQKEKEDLEAEIEYLVNYYKYIDYDERMKMNISFDKKKGKREEDSNFILTTKIQVSYILNRIYFL
jgi:hypothetical protein